MQRWQRGCCGDDVAAVMATQRWCCIGCGNNAMVASRLLQQQRVAAISAVLPPQQRATQTDEIDLVQASKSLDDCTQLQYWRTPKQW